MRGVAGTADVRDVGVWTCDIVRIVLWCAMATRARYRKTCNVVEVQ